MRMLDLARTYSIRHHRGSAVHWRFLAAMCIPRMPGTRVIAEHILVGSLAFQSTNHPPYSHGRLPSAAEAHGLWEGSQVMASSPSWPRAIRSARVPGEAGSRLFDSAPEQFSAVRPMTTGLRRIG